MYEVPARECRADFILFKIEKVGSKSKSIETGSGPEEPHSVKSLWAFVELFLFLFYQREIYFHLFISSEEEDADR